MVASPLVSFLAKGLAVTAGEWTSRDVFVVVQTGSAFCLSSRPETSGFKEREKGESDLTLAYPKRVAWVSSRRGGEHQGPHA